MAPRGKVKRPERLGGPLRPTMLDIFDSPELLTLMGSVSRSGIAFYLNSVLVEDVEPFFPILS